MWSSVTRPEKILGFSATLRSCDSWPREFCRVGERRSEDSVGGRGSGIPANGSLFSRLASHTVTA